MSGVITAKEAKAIRAEVLRKRKEGVKAYYSQYGGRIRKIPIYSIKKLETKRGMRGFNLGHSWKDHSVPLVRTVYTALKKEAIEMLKRIPVESDGKEYDPNWQEAFCMLHGLQSDEVERYVKLKGEKNV